MFVGQKKGLAAVIAAVAITTVLSSCSSSGSGGGSDTSPANSGTTPAATGSSGGGASDPVAAASASAANFEKAPTELSVTTPLTSKPGAGKTFIWMNCDLDTCTPIGQGVKEAVEAAGWKFRQISFKAEDPATLVAGMKQALQYHPSYVALSGLAPETGWSSVIPEYKKAGVKIIATFLGKETFDDTFIANVGGSSLATAGGQALAYWFIADSGGKGQAVLQRVDDFATLKLVADSFASTVAAKCPDCKVLSLNNTVSQATSGGVVPSVISTLRSHSSYNYVIASAANIVVGLPAALSGADLSDKVKYAAYAANTPALTALKNGQAAAMVGNPLHYVGWLAVDTALRDSEGMTFEPDPQIPFQLLLPSSQFELSDSEDVPADYQSQFKKLWQVG